MPDPGFQLASSPATSSLLPVAFSFVVTTHRYLAQVDAYEDAPVGGLDAGANQAERLRTTLVLRAKREDARLAAGGATDNSILERLAAPTPQWSLRSSAPAAGGRC